MNERQEIMLIEELLQVPFDQPPELLPILEFIIEPDVADDETDGILDVEAPADEDMD